jgi:hypothetical protein
MSMAVLPRLVLTLTFGQAQPAPGADPELALKACDLMVTEGRPTTAIPCFEGLRVQFPGTPQAHDAERALWVLRSLPAAPLPSLTPPGPAIPPAGKDSFYVLEPYSTKTKERLRLSTWEKLDFGISAFLYGMSTGLSFGLATESDNVVGSMVVGAVLYTGLAGVYVNTAQVDRGDLPLVLGVSSYIPLTATFITLATDASASGGAAAVVTSGLLALPAAYWVASATDLDPGDTQLVRDAGFWGAIWGATTALATTDDFSNRRLGIGGMVGLYGGLGLGLLLASTTDISLERVRVTTWGGYGGTLLGGLVAISDKSTEKGVWAHLAVGSAIGVLVTFAATGSIDAPPANADFRGRTASVQYLEPTLLPVIDLEGRTRAQAGLSLARGRF